MSNGNYQPAEKVCHWLCQRHPHRKLAQSRHWQSQWHTSLESFVFIVVLLLFVENPLQCLAFLLRQLLPVEQTDEQLFSRATEYAAQQIVDQVA